jgi:HK97 family phage major capsid protein
MVQKGQVCGTGRTDRESPLPSGREISTSARLFLWRAANLEPNMQTFRKATLGQPDLESRSVPLVLATTHPVQRQGYLEVLDISPEGVDLSRGDLPLIESHDATRVNIGMVRDIRIEAGVLRGVAVFGTSARAEELLADVMNHTVTGISIGYQLLDEGTDMALPDSAPARSFRFMPYEVSIVSVPADPNAGFHRAANSLATRLPVLLQRETLTLRKPAATHTPKPAHQFRGSDMNTITYDEPTGDAAEISAIAAEYPGSAELALRCIQRGLSTAQFQQELIKQMSTKPIPTAFLPDESRTSSNEPMKRLRGAEDYHRHFSARASAEHAGLTMSDFLRGAARMKTTEQARRALSTLVGNDGGFTVPTTLMPNLLSALAPVSALVQAGSPIVPLGDGAKSYSFAAVDALPVASWRNENDPVPESQPTFRSVVLTPRSLSFVVIVSRELMADGMNIDGAIYGAIAQAFAKELDRAGLRGSGTAPEPRGLRNTPGIQTVSNGANGAVLSSYANFFAATQAILAANAPMPTAAIMGTRSRIKLADLKDTTGQPLQVPQMLSAMQLVSTTQIPENLTVGTSTDASEMLIGDFANFVTGMREELSIQMLEELYAGSGQVGFMCHARVDFAALYPTAFALVTGVR